MQALGLIAASTSPPTWCGSRTTVRPDPAAAATYAALLPLFAELYDALAPTFAVAAPAGPRPAHRALATGVSGAGQGASTPAIR